MNGIEFRRLRESLAMTQKELAKLMGKHYMTIGMWERRGDKELPLHGKKAFLKIRQIVENQND